MCALVVSSAAETIRLFYQTCEHTVKRYKCTLQARVCVKAVFERTRSTAVQ
jgi:hypothetical protein